MADGFLRNLRHWPRAFANWICAGRDDYQAFQSRKAKPRHRRCRRLCVSIWIFAAAVMAIWPEVAVILSLTLIATFLCFAILDGD